MRLPHEILAKIQMQDPKSLNPLNQDAAEWDVPIFRNHLVVATFGLENTAAVTLYSDSTPMSKSDSLYCVYLQVAWSRKRHLVFAVKKSSMCRCGCKGAP